MSRKYKFGEKEGAYFVSFATVYWIDVFTRVDYLETIIESLDYCRKNKGMEIYGYCIMPSHVPPASASILLVPIKTKK